jgi:hypothetical protein
MSEYPSIPTPPPAPAPTSSISETRRKELLDRFGLISEDDLALMLGISIKTLKNKPITDLPEHTLIGRKRFYYVKSIEMKLRANVQRRPFRRRGS